MLPLANFFPVQYQKFDKILQDRPIVQIYVIDTQWFSSWNVARSFSWQASKFLPSHRHIYVVAGLLCQKGQFHWVTVSWACGSL